jgi:hypothetical protein
VTDFILDHTPQKFSPRENIPSKLKIESSFNVKVKMKIPMVD